jgi:hypothetical protein
MEVIKNMFSQSQILLSDVQNLSENVHVGTSSALYLLKLILLCSSMLDVPPSPPQLDLSKSLQAEYSPLCACTFKLFH